jgi:hypothetical protein
MKNKQLEIAKADNRQNTVLKNTKEKIMQFLLGRPLLEPCR